MEDLPAREPLEEEQVDSLQGSSEGEEDNVSDTSDELETTSTYTKTDRPVNVEADQASVFQQLMATLATMQERIIANSKEIAQMRVDGSSKSKRKVVKTVVPESFTGVGRTRKVKDFLLELDLYFEAQDVDEGSKVSNAMAFLKEHALQWWTSYREDNPEAVSNLTWADFKNLLKDRFTPQYQSLRDGVNMIKLKQTGSLKAYVREFSAFLNMVPKMDDY